MCLKESWRYYRRENGDSYEDSLTRHLREIRLIKNRSRVRSWLMEWCTVLPVCVCACVRVFYGAVLAVLKFWRSVVPPSSG